MSNCWKKPVVMIAVAIALALVVYHVGFDVTDARWAAPHGGGIGR